MSEATVAVHARAESRGDDSDDKSAAGVAHEESVMKHGEGGPSSRVQDAAAGPSPAGEESSAAGTTSDQGGSFDCNICLELAQDPVVTLCGHLFCWPCLYRWLQMHSICQECPVCKASVEEEKVIPLYGRGKVNCVDPRTKAIPGLNIPHRPAGQRPETARHVDHQYPPQGFNFMAGPAGPAATARFGLGFDGERQFSEPGLGFSTEPSMFFNDEGWISTSGPFVNFNEAAFMDANEGPPLINANEDPPANATEGSPVDVNEGPFVDANEGPPVSVSEDLHVNANEGPPTNVSEGHANEDEVPFVNANKGPAMDAKENISMRANEGVPMDVNEDPPVDNTNEGLPSNANEAPFVDANEGPLVDVNANEGPVVDVSEGPHVIAPLGNSVQQGSNL